MVGSNLNEYLMAGGFMTENYRLPQLRGCPFGSPSIYSQLRREHPIAKVQLPRGREAWLATSHKDVRTILSDPGFSCNRAHPSFPTLVSDERTMPTGKVPSLIGMDPPEHLAARRALIGEFTIRRVGTLRPRIQRIVDEQVDAMLMQGPPLDLVSALSLPVPSRVICELLGVPYADHEFFQASSASIVGRDASARDRDSALGELLVYLDELVMTKQKTPGDDLLSRQIARGGEFGHEWLVSQAFLLLIAGHETTASMISLGTLAIMQSDEHREYILSGDAHLSSAVEELLRYFAIADLVTSRVAAADMEIHGVLVRADDGIIASTLAASRDPGAFADPDTLDMRRGSRHHLAFGFGAHQCLGQNLARAELGIVYETLFRRIPRLRAAASIEDLPAKDDASIYGLYSLPVTW
jgi:cytochrome P450